MSFNFFGREFYFLADERQLQKAINMLEKYVFNPGILVLLLVLAVYFVLRCSARILKKDKLSQILRKISPWIYLLVILGITLLNRAGGTREVRLTPDSWLTKNGFHESTVLGFMFNMAIYIPLGYLTYKWAEFEKKVLTSAIIIIMVSLFVEILQYVFARGVTAIDDFFANVLGGLIGLGFAVLLQKIKDKK